ncbi:hypothetical protein DP939_04160 [Spongiactinospora rosea]|uniref:Uncharacterized protein n=1 Tax=Spongiactinospora rosea TaxID=2248750 RepID=A0A366M6T0_9ACTN|nr:hypothetical protein [Spongiactinospora rosea]RBQ21875.1 hypothetical protein DP939_04160 [Spongiactinospora rosea]
MSDIIFLPTDLANRRTEFLEAARKGQARLRDKDGTSLVMLPESRLRLLETLSKWWEAYMKLEQLLRRKDLPKAGELGELAWLRTFDRDDLTEFLGELNDALVAASADEDTAILDECVAAWRNTARQLEDPLRRSVLLGEHRPGHYVEVTEPDEQG